MSHYFLAIQIPEALQEFYQSWQTELRDVFPYKKWTEKEDLHITLAFLGEATERQILDIKRRLDTSEFTDYFTVTLGKLGTFGRPDRPRVLYVEVEPNEKLNNLQKQIVKVTELAGFRSENRPYRPHVTLGKKWGTADSLPKGMFHELESKYSSEKQLEVSQVTLFKIHPQKTPSYEVVAIFPLKS